MNLLGWWVVDGCLNANKVIGFDPKQSLDFVKMVFCSIHVCKGCNNLDWCIVLYSVV